MYSKYLVGADGIHSPVRNALNIPYEGYKVPDTMHIIEGVGVIPELYKDALVITGKPKAPILTVLYIGKKSNC